MSEQENERRDDRISSGDIKISTPFMKRLENFFYHYKWHTIIAVFILFTLILCTVQMCSKTSYDLYVLYAGGENIGITASDGEQSDRAKLSSALMQYAEDLDGDGNRNISIKSLYIPRDGGEFNPDIDIGAAAVQENRRMLNETMLVGDYYLCFLSEEIFRELTEGENIFMLPIAPYADGDADYEYASEYGIYLKSTDLYAKAGFSLLPEDTVICIRRRSDIFNDARQAERFAAAEEALRALIG